MFILNNLDNPGIAKQGNIWNFFTNGVIGGLSSGKVEIENILGKKCYLMTRNVTTKNNGASYK